MPAPPSSQAATWAVAEAIAKGMYNQAVATEQVAVALARIATVLEAAEGRDTLKKEGP